jgi:nitrous oxide reductase accessory protein NosL
VKRLLLAPVLALALIAAAGCGGGDDGGAAAPTTTAEEASCERDQLTLKTPGKLTIGSSSAVYDVPW